MREKLEDLDKPPSLPPPSRSNVKIPSSRHTVRPLTISREYQLIVSKRH